ncbi:MAG: hypothetical protein IT331_15040 [Anaerolineae bacterium]|nr:hypothetical protein [Anaerolineae bacterium]
MWLVRLNPQARTRFLTLLYEFLEWSGYGPLTATAAIADAKQNPPAMWGKLKAYIAVQPDCRETRMFALAGLRSFFSRARVFLPSDPFYDPGGKIDEWWL